MSGATDNQIQQRIVQKAEELFLKFTVSKVTVDEIASELGMSKKTLYKYFDSKEALVREVLQTRHCRITGGIHAIIQSSEEDFVERLEELMRFIGNQFSQVSPRFLHDLRKIVPQACKEMEHQKRLHTLEAFKMLGKEGIRQGYFRDDIDLEFLGVMYISLIEGVMDSETVMHLPLSTAQVFQSVLEVLFFGLFTEQGRQKVNLLSWKNATAS